MFSTLVQNSWGPKLGHPDQWFSITTGQIKTANETLLLQAKLQMANDLI